MLIGRHTNVIGIFFAFISNVRTRLLIIKYQLRETKRKCMQINLHRGFQVNTYTPTSEIFQRC